MNKMNKVSFASTAAALRGQRMAALHQQGSVLVRSQHRNFVLMDYWKMLGKYFSNRSTVLPAFDAIDDRNIEAECGIKASLVYDNCLYWMPRFYQQSHLSQEFLAEMQKFKKTQVWRDEDLVALTQLILIEATRDTTFDVSFDFTAKPSNLCAFHGSIDCLLYQRYGGEHLGVPDLNEVTAGGESDRRGIGFPLIPVFFPLDHQLSSGIGPANEHYPLSQVVSAGMWCLEHMSAIDPTI